MIAGLRSIWDASRPPGARPPGRVDAALAVAAALATLLEGVLRADLPNRVLSVTSTLAVTPLLYWRRKYPMHTVAAAFGLLTLVPLLSGGRDPDMNALAAVLILVFALLRWGSGREVLIGLAFVVVKLAGWQLGVGKWTELLGAAALLTTLGAVALAVRYRAGVRERELERVKLLEREQLARDLHDVVAHHVSAMAVRAQAGLALAGAQGQKDDPAVEALRVIEAEATRALGEMRAMVRMLRRNQDHEQEIDLVPSPGVRDITELARGGAGLKVRVTMGDVGEVPPGVGSAVFRLAQEAVTNARRHARNATRVDVVVEADPERLRLSVSDDGEPVRALSPGYGLIGMAERAHLLGGRCTAGPGDPRGWVVTADLPRAGWES